jgi:hypothetical protein
VESSRDQSINFPERRGATRYDVDLRIETWAESDNRQANSILDRTRNVSLAGIYFITDVKREIGIMLNFCVVFFREFSGDDTDLITGLARVVRCEHLPGDDTPPFGLALSIEQTTHLDEG